jgi:hypothetical protein
MAEKIGLPHWKRAGAIAAAALALSTSCGRAEDIGVKALSQNTCRFIGKSVLTHGYIKFVTVGREPERRAIYELHSDVLPDSPSIKLVGREREVFLPAVFASDHIYSQEVTVDGEIRRQSEANCYLDTGDINTIS